MSAHAVWHDNSTWPPSLGAVEADAVVARHAANRHLFESLSGRLPPTFTLLAGDLNASSHDDPCNARSGSVVITPDNDIACLVRT